MRISEITDAQGQLELLRTVIDNTWTAIAQQAEQERRAQANRKAQARLKPRTKKSSKATYVPAAPPLKKPPTQALKPSTHTATLPYPNKNNPLTPLPSTLKPLPSTNTQAKPQLNPTALANPNSAQALLQKPSTAPKDGYFGKNTGAVEKDDDTTDRHSKNGIATLKKLPHSF